MDTSKLEEQFAALRESNQQLAEIVRIRDAEIVVIEEKTYQRFPLPPYPPRPPPPDLFSWGLASLTFNGRPS